MSQIKASVLLVPDLQWSLARPTCSKIENILVLAKIAAWEHRKYLWSRHLSDFSTWNTLRRIVRFSALILFLTSPSHDLHYMHTWWMRRHCSKLIQLLGNARRWNANRQGQNMLFWNHHSLLMPSLYSLWIAVMQILLSVNSMLDGCEITETKEISACEVLRAQELTHNTHRHTHTHSPPTPANSRGARHRRGIRHKV